MARPTETPMIVPEMRYRHILVATESVRRPPDLLEDAVAVAIEHRAVLTIVGLVAAPPPAAVNTGYPLAWLRREALEMAADELRELVRSLPPDISVRTMARCGKPRTEILRFLRDPEYDVVFVDCCLVAGYGWRRLLHGRLAQSRRGRITTRNPLGAFSCLSGSGS